MTSITEIPKPKDSGSDGNQQREVESHKMIQPQSIGQPLTQAIVGLAASNTRAFGSEVTSTLVAGAMSQMSIELENTRQELAMQRDKNEKLFLELSSERVNSAVLAERIDSFRSSRHMKNLGVAAGTILFGLGFQLIRGGSSQLGIASIIGGGLLIIVSWFSVPKGGDK